MLYWVLLFMHIFSPSLCFNEFKFNDDIQAENSTNLEILIMESTYNPTLVSIDTNLLNDSHRNIEERQQLRPDDLRLMDRLMPQIYNPGTSGILDRDSIINRMNEARRMNEIGEPRMPAGQYAQQPQGTFGAGQPPQQDGRSPSMASPTPMDQNDHGHHHHHHRRRRRHRRHGRRSRWGRRHRHSRRHRH